MRIRDLVLVLMVVAPGVAGAQGFPGSRRGGGTGGMGGRTGGMMRPSFETPSAKDLEKDNPVAQLIDKKKKLALTDSQLTRITAVRDSLHAKNATLLAQVDSLKKELPRGGFGGMREGGGGGGSDDDRAKHMEALRSYMAAVHEVVENDRAASIDALTALTEAQKPEGTKIVEDKMDKLAKYERGPGDREGEGEGMGRGRGRRP